MSKFSGRTYDLPKSPLSVRFLKLQSPEVSAKNAAGLVFSLCLHNVLFGFYKLVVVLMLSWSLLAGSVSSGVLLAVSTSFSEVLYSFSDL